MYLFRRAVQTFYIFPTPVSSPFQSQARTVMQRSVQGSNQYNRMVSDKYGSVFAILHLFHRMAFLPDQDMDDTSSQASAMLHFSHAEPFPGAHIQPAGNGRQDIHME